MRYLAVDRILTKDELLRSKHRLGTTLKERISSRRQLAEWETLKIDQFVKDIQDESCIRLVSVRTPFEAVTPIHFDLVFNYQDLEGIEDTTLRIEHILYLKQNYLTQLPVGHHCEVFVMCKQSLPQLFKTLPIDAYDQVKIGICNKEDWPLIQAELKEARREFEAWKKTKN